jgi:DNA-directed RNA polymerase specialized sigma24 family protein
VLEIHAFGAAGLSLPRKDTDEYSERVAGLRPVLYRAARRRLRNRDEAEDVAQDALMNLLSRAASLEGLSQGELYAYGSRAVVSIVSMRSVAAGAEWSASSLG